MNTDILWKGHCQNFVLHRDKLITNENTHCIELSTTYFRLSFSKKVTTSHGVRSGIQVSLISGHFTPAITQKNLTRIRRRVNGAFECRSISVNCI